MIVSAPFCFHLDEVVFVDDAVEDEVGVVVAEEGPPVFLDDVVEDEVGVVVDEVGPPVDDVLEDQEGVVDGVVEHEKGGVEDDVVEDEEGLVDEVGVMLIVIVLAVVMSHHVKEREEG